MDILVIIGLISLGLYTGTLINQILGIFTKKKQSKTVVFNTELMQAYDEWLMKALKTHMVTYIDEYTGTNLVKVEEMKIDSDFAVGGIKYVCDNIIKTMPNIYLQYMRSFYGEDKLLDSIYNLARQVFTAYVSDEKKRRLSSQGNN